MNREILFRGKRKDDGTSDYVDEWVYGYYCPMPFSRFPCKPCIFPADTINSHWHGVEIIENTIGQYTGLTDKNGVKIFEGDIARFKRFKDNYVGKIIFNNKTTGFEFWWNVVVGAYGEKATRCANLSVCDEIEIIGNIHDNPELLGG